MYVLFSDASFNGNCFNELHEISLRASCSLVVCLQIMFSVYEDHASDKLYAQWWGMVVGELGGGTDELCESVSISVSLGFSK